MQKRFGVLRFTAGVFKVLGIVAAIFAVVACGLTVAAVSASPQMITSFTGSGDLVDMGSGGTVAGLFGAFLVLAGGLITALCLFALGELIDLLIATEENTRNAAVAARKDRAQSPGG
jgi:hypothetical protein